MITQLKNGRIKIDRAHGDGRITVVIDGDTRYRVEPANPQKLKHRGEVGTLVKFGGFMETAAKMRRERDNRVIAVDITDLVPA